MSQFKKIIFGYVLRKFNDLEKEVLAEELLKNIPKQELRRKYFEILFPIDFKDVPDDRRRFEIYARIGKATSIIELLKSKYTRSYEAFFKAPKEDQDFLKGRIMEVSDILDSSLSAGDILANWDSYQKRKAIKRNILNNYLNK